MSSRPRGRGRGRARSVADEEPVRRPGETHESQVNGGQASSRARYHGNTDQPGEAGGPAGLDQAVSQMQQMNIGLNQGSQGQPRSQYQEQGARPKQYTKGNHGNAWSGRQDPGSAQSANGVSKAVNMQAGRGRGVQRGVEGRQGLGSNPGNGGFGQGQREAVNTLVPQGQSHSRPVNVVVNAFPVESILAEYVWFSYHVDYNPPVDSKRVRCALIEDHRALIGDTRAFDGMKLIIPRKLHNNVTEVYSLLRTDGSQVRLTITFVKELSIDSPESMQINNIILKRVQRMLGNEPIGRDYYDHSLATNSVHGITIIPGFSAAIQNYHAGNLLVIDVTHKLLQTQSVLDQMYQIYNLHERNTEKFEQHCNDEIVKQIVLTKYNNKTYQVADIAWDERPTNSFTLANGESTTFLQYYQRHYGVNPQDIDQDQPLLVIRPSRSDRLAGRTENIKLLPQLCFMTGMPKRALDDFRLKTSIQSMTRVAPQQRVNELTKFVKKCNETEAVKNYLESWNMAIPSKLLTVQGKQLFAESIMQRNVELKYNKAAPDWTRDMRCNPLTTPVHLSNWVIISPRSNAGTVSRFVEMAIRVGAPMGVVISPPARYEVSSPRISEYVSSLREVIQPTTQLVLCVVPTQRADTYNAIKKICCVEHPVPSQVVVQRTINKQEGLNSVCTKIIIQLNCKLGGELWTARMPNIPSLLMVVGIDIYHDKGRDPSVAGIVCSLNKECTRYYSSVSRQMNRQELVDGIYVKFAEALHKFHEANGALPGNIVVYRDGVGDGQLDSVRDHEIKQIDKCVAHLYGEDKIPKMAVIVVKKRINQRMYTQSKDDFYCNPEPGTIVDSQITKNGWSDFFLVSQSVRQGTVSPTHYNLIYNTINHWTMDRFQKLSYKLCHLYYNWPGTIRVPAPVQYAHKIAYLVGMNIKTNPHPALQNRLFYL